MKQAIILIASLLSAFILLSLCLRQKATVGEELVFVRYPLLFGASGVDKTSLQSGSCLKLPWTKVYRFTVTPTQYIENFDNLVTKDGTVVFLNVYLILKIKRGQTPFLLETYNLDFYENIIKEPFREIVRDRFSKYNLLDLVGDRVIYENEIKDYIKIQLLDYFEKKQLPIIIEELVISRVEPPVEIKKELAYQSIVASMVETYKQQAIAEDERANTERSRANADKVYMKEMGFTNQQFIDYLRAKSLFERDDILRIDNIK